MRRASFLRLTGLSASDLKIRALRDQLPWQPRNADSGWTEYTPFDAFLVVLSDGLLAKTLGMASAAREVRNRSFQLKADWGAIIAGEEDYFIAVAQYAASKGDHDLEKIVTGTLAQVGAGLAFLKGRTVRHIVIKSASDAWRNVQDRATGSEDEDPIDLSDAFGEGAG